MKTEWRLAPMGTLCSISSGKSNSQDAKEDGRYAFFDRSKTIKTSARYLYDCEALIIPGEGAEFLPRHFIGKFDLHQRAYALSDFSCRISVKYLYYYLNHFKDYFVRVAVGATVKSLRLRHFEELPVPVPPLHEQQRIVGILDEAFAGLASAKISAEKNIQNARALFESHLQSVFTKVEAEWVERSFEECIEGVKYTTKIQRKDFLSEGAFPVISQEADFINGYWNDISDVFNVTRPLVIFGDHTRVLKYISFDFVLGADGVKILSPKPFLYPKFFFYALRSRPLRSLGYSRHYRSLKEFKISYPDINTQAEISGKMDALLEETQRLEATYRQKLTALDELKKSLLHQAFTGQLTAA